MPTLQDVFDAIGEAQPKYFSTLDLASGFWQLELDADTKKKTAFVTPHGKWEYNRMPFGLSNAPAAFQMTMNSVLQGLTWDSVLVYIDDLVTYSKSWALHLQHLRNVFDRLRQANLRLKPSKCQFAAKRILYLGHYISKEGIEVNEEKIEAVKSYPSPTNVKQLRSFLGLANFYRRFVPGYAQIATPLNKLLKKDARYEWKEACEEAFQKLKKALTSAPLLGHPNLAKEFILRTDASADAIGYVLRQEDDNNDERPMSFGGRATRDAEKRWPITELEGLAVLEAVRANHYFLASTKFHIYTDHQALKTLFTDKDKSKKLIRWSLELQRYRYEIHFIAGKKNQAADASS